MSLDLAGRDLIGGRDLDDGFSADAQHRANFVSAGVQNHGVLPLPRGDSLGQLPAQPELFLERLGLGDASADQLRDLGSVGLRSGAFRGRI